VISQDPGGGSQLEKGHTVTITVSKGSETVSVPDIATGTPVGQARKTLEGAGLKVKVRNILGGGSSGSVFQLDPPSGTQVHRGDTIAVYAFWRVIARVRGRSRAVLTAFPAAEAYGLRGWERTAVHLLAPGGTRVRVAAQYRCGTRDRVLALSLWWVDQLR